MRMIHNFFFYLTDNFPAKKIDIYYFFAQPSFFDKKVISSIAVTDTVFGFIGY